MNKNKNKKYHKMKQINIRVTEEDRELLHEISSGLGYKSTSKYMLEVAKNPVLFIEAFDHFLEIDNHLSMIGNNINQVAKRVNSNEFVLQEDLEEIYKNQIRLEGFFKLIKEFYFFEKSTLKEMYKYGDY